MISAQTIEDCIRSLDQNATIQIRDLTGTEDHYQAIVVSQIFEGKSRVQRQQVIFSVLKDHMDSGALHALTLKTLTPDQLDQLGQ